MSQVTFFVDYAWTNKGGFTLTITGVPKVKQFVEEALTGDWDEAIQKHFGNDQLTLAFKSDREPDDSIDFADLV